MLATEPLEYGKATLPAIWIEDQRMLLMQQLLLVRPKVCLLQGAEAIKAVLGKSMSLANTESEVVERTFDCSLDPDKEDLVTIKFRDFHLAWGGATRPQLAHRRIKSTELALNSGCIVSCDSFIR